MSAAGAALDQQHATMVHRAPRNDGEVDQDFLQKPRCAANGGRAAGNTGLEPDCAAEGAPQSVTDADDQVLNEDHLRRGPDVRRRRV